MSETTEDQKKAYSEAAASGQYNRKNSIEGKYDNVRLYWEDQITRIKLQPHIKKLYGNRKKNNKKIRLIDLGCGSGDGFELLMNIKDGQSLDSINTNIIKSDDLEFYLGLDLNEDLLAQNKERWNGDESKFMQFKFGDLSKGLPCRDSYDAFDIYFTSYGTFSHLNTDETINLLKDIALHAKNGALIICDWLGRYSYEWQTLWDSDINNEKWMKYLISYIYPPEIRDKVELSSLDLRLLSSGEINKIINEAGNDEAYSLKVCDTFDRSLFIGRHMDTADYNPYLTPKRSVVNSLHEINRRTNLDDLFINYHEDKTFPEINNYFIEFQSYWNSLVTYAVDLIDQNNNDLDISSMLEKEILSLKQLFENKDRYTGDDFRANLFEPVLFYALRNLELNFQKGRGMGHGLVSIIEVVK